MSREILTHKVIVTGFGSMNCAVHHNQGKTKGQDAHRDSSQHKKGAYQLKCCPLSHAPPACRAYPTGHRLVTLIQSSHSTSGYRRSRRLL
jgi:hypothetical protein